MGDKPMTIDELFDELDKVEDKRTPVIFEIVENGDAGHTNWSVDQIEMRNGFAVLKSID